MNSPLQQRQQRAAEYMLENSRLTADLTDPQAAPLIEWASHQAYVLAGNPHRSDADVDALLGHIRRAVRAAARAAAADIPPAQLVDHARVALDEALDEDEKTQTNI